MRLVAELLRLSATDLSNHLGCVHLSQLDLAVAEGRARRPHRNDPIVELLAERGREHEAAYLRHLRAQKLGVVEIRVPPGEEGVETTLAAMRDGADVIYQAPLGDGRWYGRADFLVMRSSRPRRAPERSCSSASTRTCSKACKVLDLSERASSHRTTSFSRRPIASTTTVRITGS
jgi:uncharacterized protein